jgi:molybdenum cofactor cytidylyltransferase
MKVGGIVLAAGRSSRMGKSKALLDIDGETFLERAIGILLGGGCESVTVVLAPGEAAGRPGDLARARGAGPIENPLEGAEQIDSLPVYRDRPGHPVLFARAVWAELADSDLEEGARDVVHRHAEEIRDVAIDDRGVTVDVDTPDDYEREVTK